MEPRVGGKRTQFEEIKEDLENKIEDKNSKEEKKLVYRSPENSGSDEDCEEDLAPILLLKKKVIKMCLKQAAFSVVYQREDEIKKIVAHLTTSNHSYENSRILFISGQPGIGKTATMTSILADEPLFQEAPIKLIYNTMNFKDSYEFLQHLSQDLCSQIGRKYSATHNVETLLLSIADCLKEIDKYTILVLDELDSFNKKHRAAITSIFQLVSSIPKLAVVGLSNSTEFYQTIEEYFYGDQNHPCKLITFSPYSAGDIQKIITQKINDLEIEELEEEFENSEYCGKVISEPALKLLGAKTEKLKGDFRVAMEILSSALQKHLSLKNVSPISLAELAEIVRKTASTSPSEIIKCLPRNLKVILSLLRERMEKKKGDSYLFESLFKEYLQQLRGLGLACPSTSEFRRELSILESYSFISVSDTSHSVEQSRVLVKLPLSDLSEAIL